MLCSGLELVMVDEPVVRFFTVSGNTKQRISSLRNSDGS